MNILKPLLELSKSKWGEVYRMISNQSVPEAGFEYMPIYANIERSAIMKVATRPEIFPCSKVIGWILPREEVTRMILANTEEQFYAVPSLCVYGL